jgi:hypothetical protein
MLMKVSEFESLLVTIYRQKDVWLEFYHSYDDNCWPPSVNEMQEAMDVLIQSLTYADEDEARATFGELCRKMAVLMENRPAPVEPPAEEE